MESSSIRVGVCGSLYALWATEEALVLRQRAIPVLMPFFGECILHSAHPLSHFVRRRATPVLDTTARDQLANLTSKYAT